MDLTINSRMAAYYDKFIELQEKLRKSEEERLKLEMKFNKMVQITREEEQAHYRKLRSQYKRFLDEDRKRQDRNEKIIRTLERIETRINMLNSKTERIKLLRRQYQSYLQRVSHTRQVTRMESNINPTLKIDNTDIGKQSFASQKEFYDHPSINKAFKENTDEKMEILDKYLHGLSSQKSSYLETKNSDYFQNNYLKNLDEISQRLNEGFDSHKANSIAEDIMNSIYSRHYKQDQIKGEVKKDKEMAVRFADNNGIYKPEFSNTRASDLDTDIDGSVTKNFSHVKDMAKKDLQTISFKDNASSETQLNGRDIATETNTEQIQKMKSCVPKNNTADLLNNFNNVAEHRNNFNDAYNNKLQDTCGPSVPSDNGKIKKNNEYNELPKIGSMSLESDATVEMEYNLKQAGDEHQRSKEKQLNKTDAGSGKYGNNVEPTKEFLDDNKWSSQANILSNQNINDKQLVENDDTTENTPTMTRNIESNIKTNNKNASEASLDDFKESIPNKKPPQITPESEENLKLSPTNVNDQIISDDYKEQPVKYKVPEDHQVNKSSEELHVHDDQHEQSVQKKTNHSDDHHPIAQYEVKDSNSIQLNEQGVDVSNYEDRYDHSGQHSDDKLPIIQPEVRKQENLQYHNNETGQDTLPESDANRKCARLDDEQSIPEQDQNLQQKGYEQNVQPIVPQNGDTIQYDQNGQPFSQFDQEEQPLLDYDAKGLPVQQCDDNGQLISQYDQQYDENGQPVQHYDPNVQPIQQYDTTGQPIQQFPQLYDETRQQYQQYDENGQIIQQYDQNGQPLQQFDETGQFLQQYDENGQPIQQYDENGQIIPQYNHEYDEHGQPILHYNQYDENGQPIQQYDENGQPIHYDQLNQEYGQYDESGQLIQQYDEDGQPITQFEPQYDEHGQIIQQYGEDGQPITQPQYDEHGQITQQYGEDGQHITQPQYDEHGQIIQQYGEDGQPIRQPQYDEHGQIIQQYDEDGQPIRQPQYDEHGQIIQQYGEDGQPITQPQYDEHGQINQQYEHYDKQGQLPRTYQHEDTLPEQFGNSQQESAQVQQTSEESNQLVAEHIGETEAFSETICEDKEREKQKPNKVLEMLDTDTESVKQNTSKISNDSDFDFSNG